MGNRFIWAVMGVGFLACAYAGWPYFYQTAIYNYVQSTIPQQQATWERDLAAFRADLKSNAQAADGDGEESNAGAVIDGERHPAGRED